MVFFSIYHKCPYNHYTQVLDMATIRYKKRGNKFYVYEMHHYWDKELKKPRQKTKYLGVFDTDDGDYSKPGRGSSSPKLEKEIIDCGDVWQ